MNDDRSRVRDALAARSARRQAPLPGSPDVYVALHLGEAEPLVCHVTSEGARFDDAFVPEAHFRFDAPATALALLGGGGDFFSAFLAGRVRADGYLTLAFLLQAAFGDGLGEAPP